MVCSPRRMLRATYDEVRLPRGRGGPGAGQKRRGRGRSGGRAGGVGGAWGKEAERSLGVSAESGSEGQVGAEVCFRRLYVHVPFCRVKCAYCAFASEAPLRPERVRAYQAGLGRELARLSPGLRSLDSVFVGGGTPSALGAARLGEVLACIGRHCVPLPGAEWSCEVNPESLDAACAGVLSAAGVNRVSMGVQTFLPRLRRVLGRRGDPGRVSGAVACLGREGIARVSVDLIYGIPGQRLRDWEEDLRRALDLGVEHLSAYSLTWEEGTRLAGSGQSPCADDLDEAMWHLTDRVTAEYGLGRYEISNFARAGSECRHNLGIWYGDTYAGCGPAAASFDGVLRWRQPVNLDDWLQGRGVERDEIPAVARAAEILAFGLRTTAGWEIERFRRVTGRDPLALCGTVLEELGSAGLVEVTDGRIRPTRRGLLLNDSIAEAIVSAV